MKKTAFSIMAAGLTAILANTVVHAQETAPVTIPVYEWEPYSGSALHGYGLATDLTTSALTEGGYKVNHVFVPWKRALEVGKRGDYEVVPGMWFSEERSQHFAFSQPLLANEMVTVTINFDDSDLPGFDGKDGLRHKTVGLVRGYHYPDSLLSLRDVKFEEGVSLGANLKKLFFRRVDVVVGDRLASSWLGRRLFGEASDLLHVTGKPIVKRDLYVGISLKSPRHKALLATIDEELSRLKKNGTLAKRIKAYVDAARPELTDAMRELLATDKPAE